MMRDNEALQTAIGDATANAVRYINRKTLNHGARCNNAE
jgi:hypothetical protein